MQPGTFALLNEAGDGSGYEYSSGATLGGMAGSPTCGPANGGMFAYASKGAYDAAGNAVYFSGAPHASSGTCLNTTAKYDVATIGGLISALMVPGMSSDMLMTRMLSIQRSVNFTHMPSCHKLDCGG
jgi:hypothetical protein